MTPKEYEINLKSALDLQNVMLEYFEDTYGDYLFKLYTKKKPVNYVNFSTDELNFVFIFNLDYNSMVHDLRKKIWNDFEIMFDYDLGMYGCPISVEFLRLKIEKTIFSYLNKKIKIRISAGTSIFNPIKDKSVNAHATFMKYVKRADDAMYIAKAKGRNRVIQWKASA